MTELQMFKIVKKYVDEYDLEDLLKMGAPSNEYDIESKEIAKRIQKEYPTEAIAEVIYVVFAYMFDVRIVPELSDSVYTEIAEKIKHDIDAS